MQLIPFYENGIYLVLGVTKDRRVKLCHFSSLPFDESLLAKPRRSWREGEVKRREQLIDESFQLVQIECAGFDRPFENHGRKYVTTSPGIYLKLTDLLDERNEQGRCLFVIQEDREHAGIRTCSRIQFIDGTSCVRFSVSVTNIGSSSQTLEYLASFSLTGIEKEIRALDEDLWDHVGPGSIEDQIRVDIPCSSWMKELTWKSLTLEEAGFTCTQPRICRRTSKTLSVTNTGNWSAKNALPMAVIENTACRSALFFQIEHSGSWHWEIGDMHEHYYLSVSGPTEKESHFFKKLSPGETFESVPVLAGVSENSPEAVMGELTKARRLMRRPNADNERLPVIFNDYMNCLFGDPTDEKERPMIEAAAKSGCEVYVIDAGWYAPGSWWDGVGLWEESRERFPSGIRAVCDFIRSKGMVPGLWLELEVMGINCPLMALVPDDWFFVRHGKKVYDRSRCQLDFRNPQVRAYADGIIRRLVLDYGAGYIKMDYNIEPGIGTELNADSPGAGLLEHERAFLSWLDSVYEKYPDLVIENCSSGGLRMDYALLSRHSIQSMTDQEDFQEMATIAANACTGAAPEQAAIWSYPLTDADEEAVVFNMVNALLLRIHQSGHLIQLTGRRLGLVTEAISLYKKTLRSVIPKALPFWPLGLADNADNVLSAGLRCGEEIFLAVWKRRQAAPEIVLPLQRVLSLEEHQAFSAQCIYPDPAGRLPGGDGSPRVRKGDLLLTFDGPYMARLYRICLI